MPLSNPARLFEPMLELLFVMLFTHFLAIYVDMRARARVYVCERERHKHDHLDHSDLLHLAKLLITA